MEKYLAANLASNLEFRQSDDASEWDIASCTFLRINNLVASKTIAPKKYIKIFNQL
jgi:hypothetical protein